MSDKIILLLIIVGISCASCSSIEENNRGDIKPSQDSHALLIEYVNDSTSMLQNGNPCSNIYINQHLNDSLDYGMCFGNKSYTINKNFDFKLLYIYTAQECDHEYILNKFTNEKKQRKVLAGHDTDYIVAMRLASCNNIDGDFPNSNDKFTGGFHGYNNETSGNYTPTMYEVSKSVYADGVRLAPNSFVSCDSVRVVVENLIQGANTEKIDGTGRNILKQVITLTCKGGDYDVKVDLVPLEDIMLYQVNGLCFYNDFDSIQFIGSASNYRLYPRGQVVRSDKDIHTIRQQSSKYNFDVFMNLGFGLGAGLFNEDTYNASSESANKSYFNLVSKRNGLFVPKDSLLSFKGGYRFEENKKVVTMPRL